MAYCLCYSNYSLISNINILGWENIVLIVLHGWSSCNVRSFVMLRLEYPKEKPTVCPKNINTIRSRTRFQDPNYQLIKLHRVLCLKCVLYSGSPVCMLSWSPVCMLSWFLWSVQHLLQYSYLITQLMTLLLEYTRTVFSFFLFPICAAPPQSTPVFLLCPISAC